MVAGDCGNKAHDAEHLGYGGRRVLVSRKWTGKTLTDHRADRAAIVRATLEQAGIDPDEHDQLASNSSDPEHQRRYAWTRIDPRDLDAPSYGRVIAQSIRTAQRWRTEYRTAQRRAGPDITVIQQLGERCSTKQHFGNFDRRSA